MLSVTGLCFPALRDLRWNCYICERMPSPLQHRHKALKILQVKTAPDTTTAMARLLLFHCMQKTLGEGLTFLGIKPLDKM